MNYYNCMIDEKNDGILFGIKKYVEYAKKNLCAANLANLCGLFDFFSTLS